MSLRRKVEMPIKCPKCNQDNKDTAKLCNKCGHNFSAPQVWTPSWKWHLKTLGIIYSVLIIIYFVLLVLLKPYVRNIVENW